MDLNNLLKCSPDVGVNNWSSEALYLERQYKLLLEDFLHFLRKAVQAIEKTHGNCHPENTFCYGNVEFIDRNIYHSSVVHTLQMDNKSPQLKNINWEMSSKLNVGSLLLFFGRNKVTFGLVVTRSIENLQEGKVGVEFLEGEDDVFAKNSKFVMFEYLVYFEAYKHHLDILKYLKTIPFKQYVLDLEKYIQKPDYLKLGSHFDLSPLFKEQKNIPELSSSGDVYKLLMERRSETDTKGSKFLDIFEDETWTQLSNYDDSQIQAIRMALTSEVAMIQGPPGTGKSFVGTKIVQILLNNRQIWCKKSEGPILVVCYTNSALDQCLEGVLGFTQRVVRIGGRSKSEKLQKFSLAEIKMFVKDEQLRNHKMYQQEKDIFSELRELRSRLSLISLKDEIPLEDVKRMKDLSDRSKEIGSIENARIARGADVVGITSTGAAKYKDLLEALRPRIVLIEEAGEILESHVVAGLTSGCKHLILIGDHQQLRPSVSSYKLGKDEGLDISLLERLITAGLPYARLSTQHRMDPDISRLLTPVYPGLKDHESTLSRARVPGLPGRLTFVDHNFSEDKVCENSSRKNFHEASFLVNLAKYLLQLGNNPQDITILTPYTGQLRLINQLLSSLSYPDIQHVSSDTVDNFQGEESDIILLSLVRSDEDLESGIGFLSLDNRVTVALSRARRGLVMVGNLEHLCHNSNLWRKLKDILGEGVVTDLSLICSRHKKTTFVRDGEGFKDVPEGGCNQDCKEVMFCGHICPRLCHPSSKHSGRDCKMSCDRKCREGHLCSKPCGEDCGLCTIKVKKELICGHVAEVECSVNKLDVVCSSKALETLPCGHATDVLCGQQPVCVVICEYILPCGHPCHLPCHSGLHQSRCQHPCERKPKQCSGSHTCKLLCGDECQLCQLVTEKQLPCLHKAAIPCSTDPLLYDCTLKCSKLLRCGHPCKALCYEQCETCSVRGDITLPCGHTIYGQCGAPSPCNLPCDKILPCGHPCTELCGQPCTTQCQVPVFTSLNSGCKHESKSPCFLSSGIQKPCLPCNEPCGMTLPCGHTCPDICSTCSSTDLHPPCELACPRTLLCGHPCTGTCGSACPACKDKCLLGCPHGPCKGKCGDPCIPCRVKCTWRCQHVKCTKKCGVACNRAPCGETCNLVLSCGHPCVTACGESCLCYLCSKSSQVDEGCFVNLGCGCAVTASRIEQFNSDPRIAPFECPSCGVVVTYHPRFKTQIQQRMQQVSQVSDLFFALNSKLSQRKATLIEVLKSCEHVELEDFCKSTVKKIETKVVGRTVTSAQLAHFQLQAEIVIRIFDELDDVTDEELTTIKRFLSFETSSVFHMNSFLNKMKETHPKMDFNTIVYSYQSNLWFWCDKCNSANQSRNCCKCGV